jgi:hypothetical protein
MILDDEELPPSTLIPVYAQSLATHMLLLGPDHPETLTTRSHLAAAHESAGDMATAITQYEQAHSDRVRVLGPDHQQTILSRISLASAYQDVGDPERAIPLLEQMLTHSVEQSGPDSVDSLWCRHNLARACELAGDLQRAIALYEQTHADSLRVFGPDHEYTVSFHEKLTRARNLDAGRASSTQGKTIPVETTAPEDYVRCFRVHADFPVGAAGFEPAQRAVEWMRAHGSHTFHGVMVDQRGRRLTPEWIDVADGWLAEDGRLCVISGSITHAALGLEEAYDLGSHDGRNSDFFSGHDWGPTFHESLAYPRRQVYIGDVKTGRFVITEVGPNTEELAVSPDGRRYAVVEPLRISQEHQVNLTLGSTDGQGGRQTLGALDARQLRFSPDGLWLGMLSSPVGFALVDPASDQIARVPIQYGYTTGWDWWPEGGPSIVQMIYDQERETNQLVRITLTSGAAETLYEIDLGDTSVDGFQSEKALMRPRIHPDGRWMLASSRAYMNPGRESDYSDRFGLVLVDLSNGTVQPMHASYVDGPHGPFGKNVLTVDHLAHEWSRGYPRSWPTAPSNLRWEALQTVEVPERIAGEVGEDATKVAALAIEKAIGDPQFTGPGPGPLLPETVRYLQAAHRYSTTWPEFDRWLVEVETVLPQVLPQLPAGHRKCWEALVASLHLIRAGRGNDIDLESLERLGRG